MGHGIFVTGATGCVGSFVVPELLACGYRVTALVRRQRPDAEVATVVGDLRDLADVRSPIEEADGVIHLASTRAQSRDEVLQCDVLGSTALIDAWHAGPFVYASSQTVYGTPAGSPLTEQSPVHPESWYDLGKICTERALFEASALGRRGAGISLRIPLVLSVGPGQFLDLVFRECVVSRRFFFDSEEGLETYGSTFITGRDVGRCIVAALHVGETGPLNVGGGFCRWKDLIAAFNRLGGTRAEVVVRPGGRPEADESRLPQSVSLLEHAAFAERTGVRPAAALEPVVVEYLEARRRARVAS